MSASFESVRGRYAVTPIRGCPGRFMIHGAAHEGPIVVAGGASVVHRYSGRERDTVCVVAFDAGGLISYEKPDGRFVHTLCDEGGFARKLAQLGIALPR